MMIKLYFGSQIISSPNQSEVLIIDPGGSGPNEFSTLFFLEEEGGSICT